MSDLGRDEVIEEQDENDSFELDLNESAGSLDEVMREAVEAVERTREDRESDEEAVGPEETTVEIEVEAGGEGAEAGRLREQLMRTLADFDNFRKRADREKADLRRFALFDALKDFLGVQDNLERAVGASGSVEDLRLGVQMIVRQLEDIFKRHGVVGVAADGAAFDPAVHEAVGRLESEDVTQPMVADVMQKGYRLHERLLRPAMVTVAVPVAGKAASKAGGEPDGEMKDPVNEQVEETAS